MRSRVSEGKTYPEMMEILTGELRQWYELGEERFAERDAWRTASPHARIVYDHMEGAVDYGELCYEAEFLWGEIIHANAEVPRLTTGESPVAAYGFRRFRDERKIWRLERTDIVVDPRSSFIMLNCIEIKRAESEEFGRELYLGAQSLRTMFSLEIIAEIVSTGGSLECVQG